MPGRPYTVLTTPHQGKPSGNVWTTRLCLPPILTSSIFAMVATATQTCRAQCSAKLMPVPSLCHAVHDETPATRCLGGGKARVTLPLSSTIHVTPAQSQPRVNNPNKGSSPKPSLQRSKQPRGFHSISQESS